MILFLSPTIFLTSGATQSPQLSINNIDGKYLNNYTFSPIFIQTLIIASRKASFYYERMQRCWAKSKLTTPQVYATKWATYHHALIKVNEELYSAGGCYQTLASARQDLKTDSFTKYNRITNEWQMLDSLSYKRCKCVLAELNGFIYAIGGEDEDYVERYSISQNRWCDVAKMPVVLKHMSAVSYDGRIIVSGVSQIDDDPEEEGECLLVYTPSNNTWCMKNINVGKKSYGKSHVHPVLLVQDHVSIISDEDSEVPAEKCYLISYTNNGGSPGRAKVNTVKVTILNDTTTVSLTPTDDSQRLVPSSNQCAAVVIDNQVFINANGYFHNTGVETTEDQTAMVDLREWNGIRGRKEQVICFTFDQKSMKAK